MLTADQEKWVNHLSDDSIIKIVPFDPGCKEKFEKVKEIIQAKLGTSVGVEHRGASGLGISGQDEIDVYVPVSADDFNNLLHPLTELLGKPRSHYPLERARFVIYVDGKHIDVFLVNKEDQSWLDSVKFENYLKSDTDALDAYRKLKELGNGLGTREYYRKKIEFINDVLRKA